VSPECVTLRRASHASSGGAGGLSGFDIGWVYSTGDWIDVSAASVSDRVELSSVYESCDSSASEASWRGGSVVSDCGMVERGRREGTDPRRSRFPRMASVISIDCPSSSPSSS
jgi:hypothetical protein